MIELNAEAAAGDPVMHQDPVVQQGAAAGQGAATRESAAVHRGLAARRHPVPSPDTDHAGGADRLLRNGHLLTASSAIASGLGAGYWVLATRWYSPATVGRDYAAISAMMFLAGLGQLNLTNTLVRFVPAAGARTTRLVGRTYLVSAAASLALGAAFVLAIPWLSPQLDFLHSPMPGVGFVAATAGYAVFVIQDGALTGLRRADWVVLENALFAVSKIAFVAVLAFIGAGSGILLSWYTALALALLVTNRFLFAHAIPGHVKAAAAQGIDTGRPTFGYLAADFTGALCWLAAITLPPIFVLDLLGGDQSAYFSLAWVVAYALYQLSANMGSSLIVEAANDPVRLAANCRSVLRHTGLLLAGCVTVLIPLAPHLLSIFGPGYARHGTGLLRLLLLSALPNLVVAVAVSACRARRRLGVAVWALIALCTIAITLTVVLVPVIGIAGAGAGWLIAQCLVATVLILRRSWWLGPRPHRTFYRGSAADLARSAGIRMAHAARWPGDRVTVFRLIRAHGGRRASVDTAQAVLRGARTRSDLLIVRSSQAGGIAIKCPRTEEARSVLSRQYDVLQRIAADRRLGDWRRLLPRVIDCDLASSPPSGVERWLPGVTGSALLRERPSEADALTSAAIGAIAELHEATGRDEQVGPSHLARWVDEPLAVLGRGLRLPRDGAETAAIERLREHVHRRLLGRRLRVGWVHRDFHPGNVLYAAENGEVTGIVDWGGAVPDGPTVLDGRLFALALRHETGGQPIGELIVQSLGADTGDELEQALLLLTWLWHVTDNIEKSARFRSNRLWVACNVLAVLKAVNP